MTSYVSALLLSVALGATLGPAPVMIIVPQPDAPVEITSYRAYYTSGGGAYSRRGINHDLKYTNRSDKKVVAIRFGLVAFDVWNNFLDFTGGLSTDDMLPTKTGAGGWVASAYADFAFLTGVAYVDKVRFDDGTIWKADASSITQAMRKSESDFDTKNLADRPRAAPTPP